MIIPIIILITVFILIAIRQIGSIKLQIWQIMLFGAVAVLITGQISPINALKSINLDVMIFLFSMFVIGVALEESGYLSYLSYKIFKKAKNTNQLLLILFGMGFASAILMNDTLAI
jgi:Na+/H+ antiporter NhaD/arsenite permease-like protein